MRPRTFTPLLLLGGLPSVSANPLVEAFVAIGGFLSVFSASGDVAFIGLIGLALFILYLILFQMVFKAINKGNQNASPRLVNAGIIVFSAVLALFSAVNIPRQALDAVAQQYAVVGIILLWSVPLGIIAGAVYFKQKYPNPFVSIVAGVVMILLGANIPSFISSLESAGFDAASWWLSMIQLTVMIAGIWWVFSPIISLLRGDDNLATGRHAAGRLGSGAWNNLRNWRNRPRGARPGGPRGGGPNHTLMDVRVGGRRYGFDPHTGFLIDRNTGAPARLRPGDRIRIKTRATRGSFNPASTGSSAQVFDAHARPVYTIPFNPTFDAYVTGRGNGSFSPSHDEVEFDIHLPATIPPGFVRLDLVLETI